ncbi:hypothetical protein [Nonomuraea typhae]|uniref:Peptidase inhibitor family I36 n=1 Tax=Nonomuraea typhae TaxID=2603600 RepID=A0ABW7Z8K5_9ACTN
MRSQLRSILTAGTAATALAGSMLLGTGTAHAASCPSGAVCLREPDGSIQGRNIWYSYGAHNLSNVFGTKVLINNQTGGAGFQICKGYNGADCYPVLRGVGAYAPYDFTPINSIVLVR